MSPGLLDKLGPSIYGLAFKIGIGLIAVIVLAGLFFASKYGFAWWKKRKSFKITAVIYNPDGTFYIDRIGKFKDVDGIDKMLFLKNSAESMPVIDPKYIRALTITLWRYGIGQYAVIPPKVWEKLSPADFKIDVINMQQKNFAFLEQRAAISRWASLKDAIQKWAPYITFIVLAIVTGVVCWFLLKFGIGIFDKVAAERVAECAKVLGGGSLPAGATPAA
jgi:hypothetical protein